MKIQLKIATTVISAAFIAGLTMVSPAIAASDSITQAAKICMQEGRATKDSAGLPVCLKFFSSGSSLHVPVDTADVQYGTLSLDGNSGNATAQSWSLNTRDGKQIELGDISGLISKEAASYWYQVVVEINRKDKLFGVVPLVFVPKATMLSGFVGKSFVGQAESLAAPAGAKAKNFIRIDMAKSVAGESLTGTIVNLNKAIANAKNGVCEPKLLAGGATTKWVQASLGQSGKVKFEWFPAMHMVGDSELSPSFAGGVNYMAPLPTVATLLRSTVDLSTNYTFSLHGNPFAGVSKLNGIFVAAKAYKTC